MGRMDAQHAQKGDERDAKNCKITGCRPQLGIEVSAGKRADHAGDVLREAFDHHRFNGALLADQVRDERAASRPTQGPRHPKQSRAYREVPKCQAIVPQQNAKGCSDQYTDPLRENHDAHATEAIGQWPGDESGEQKGDGSVKSDECHVKRRVGHLENEPPGDDHFHPHGLPPQRVAHQQIAKAAVAQRREGSDQFYALRKCQLSDTIALREVTVGNHLIDATMQPMTLAVLRVSTSGYAVPFARAWTDFSGQFQNCASLYAPSP